MTTRPRPALRRAQARRAVADLLAALGCRLRGELAGTPARVAALWTEHLLAGEGADLGALLGRGSGAPSAAPVTLLDVGVHLVCPHHLTVAFGTAHVGYLPRRRVAGFGALARLIHACTARLVLQEDASTAIARALCDHLDAEAAVAVIDATHPCHNVPHGRSHRAHAVTWGQAGSRRGAAELRRLLRAALCRR